MYRTQALGTMPVQLPGFTDAGFPVQDKNGIFWVSDALRPAAAAALGTGARFVSIEAKGTTQFGTAYTGAGPDWIAQAVAEGFAVLVKPANIAPPGVRVVLTRDPYRIAYHTARAFEPDHAILVAPTALVARAEAEVRAGYRGDPSDYGSSDQPGLLSRLPSWAVPAAAGAALLLALAALVRPARRATPNAKRGHRKLTPRGRHTGRTGARHRAAHARRQLRHELHRDALYWDSVFNPRATPNAARGYARQSARDRVGSRADERRAARRHRRVKLSEIVKGARVRWLTNPPVTLKCIRTDRDTGDGPVFVTTRVFGGDSEVHIRRREQSFFDK